MRLSSAGLGLCYNISASGDMARALPLEAKHISRVGNRYDRLPAHMVGASYEGDDKVTEV